MLHNLGVSLLYRFEQLGDLDDLTDSLLKHQDAIHLTPDGHPDKYLMLSNLGISLYCQFQQLGELNDLNKSISIQADAICLIPEDHPDKAGILYNFGNALLGRFRLSMNPNDLQEIIHHYISAVCSTTSPASVRFKAASMWADVARIGLHSSLLQAYHVALDLLPEVAWLGLSINDRHHQIIEAGSVVRDAAAAAISGGQLDKAVEWLEQGRSIIWGQLLNLRTPVDDLRHHHSELADELIILSALLEGATTQRNGLPLTDSENQQSFQSITQQVHENTHKRDVLLKKIRELEGFQQFLLPKSISALSAAAKGGAVVLLNASTMSCDALALHFSNEVRHVPLPDFTPAHARTLTQSLERLLPYMGRGDIDRLHGHREGGSQGLEDDFAHILSELWVRLVKPVLDALAITVSSVNQIVKFMLNVIIGSNKRESTAHLVVSNRSSYISTNPCCRVIWKG
jgi:hypothetical protein